MEGQQQSYEQKLAEEQKKMYDHIWYSQVEEYKQSILSQILTP
jgi:DNA-binding TFAR19-related protein (PDSD5 family)